MKKALFSIIFSLSIMGTSGFASAATVADGCSNSFLGFPTWYSYLQVDKDATGKCNINTDATGGTTPLLILMAVFDILLYLAGMLAVVFVVYGGFKMLTSAGEPGKITASRTTLFNALIGLAIAVLASQVVGFIAGKLS